MFCNRRKDAWRGRRFPRVTQLVRAQLGLSDSRVQSPDLYSKGTQLASKERRAQRDKEEGRERERKEGRRREEEGVEREKKEEKREGGEKGGKGEEREGKKRRKGKRKKSKKN